jgi:nucleoid-associated protein YgaU
MRKDVILGMSIGGVMLAVVIIYLTVYTNTKHDRHGVETANALAEGGSGGSGDAPGQSGDPATGGEYKPTPFAPHSDDAAPGKPTFLGATTVEKTDPVWGKRLWANTVVSVTPDPNGNTPGAEPQPTADSATDKATSDKATGEVPGGGAKTSLVPPSASNPIDPPTPSPDKTTDKPAVATSHTHKVQKGETLSTIAAAAYGSPNLYPYILRANPKIDPTKLKLGMELNMPDISEVKGPEKTPDKSAEKSTDAGTITHKVEPAVDAKTEYRVQSGDSLHKISMKLYGNISMVQKIYDANKTAIGDNPAKLKLGMVLKLPAAPTSN